MPLGPRRCPRARSGHAGCARASARRSSSTASSPMQLAARAAGGWRPRCSSRRPATRPRRRRWSASSPVAATPTDEQVTARRDAARSCRSSPCRPAMPTRGSRTSSRRTSSTACRAEGFPVDEVAAALARALGRDGPVARALAARSPGRGRAAPGGRGRRRRRRARSARPSGRRTAPAVDHAVPDARPTSRPQQGAAAARRPACVARRRSRRRSLASLATGIAVGRRRRAAVRRRHRLVDATAAVIASLGLAALFRRVAARLP